MKNKNNKQNTNSKCRKIEKKNVLQSCTSAKRYRTEGKVEG